MKSRRVKVFLWALLPCLWLTGLARAGGGGDHSHAEEAPATTVAASGGASETELELRLSDLSKGSAGVSVPLKNAKIRGFLKDAGGGDILRRVTARAEKTPGVYSIYFNDDQIAYAFPGPGKYALELNIAPASGDAFDTTVAFVLPEAVAPQPAWRRIVPFAIGALALLAMAWLLLRWRRRKTIKPDAALLGLLAVVGFSVQFAWAHDGEDHGDEEAPPMAAATGAVLNIQPGETTTTTKAGDIQIVLITRTRAAAAKVAAPGEVTLPAQTAELLKIKTAPAQVSQLETGVSFTGQIAPDPNATVRVSSLVPGRVTRLAVAQGDRVSEGQTLAVVESRAIGEAQSSYGQAVARFENAKSNLSVVRRQAQAGVFSRAPVEVARQASAVANGDVAVQEAAVGQAQVALDNALRLARSGAFSSPALEAAKGQAAQAKEATGTTQAALGNARSSVEAAQAEVERRKQLAAGGAYGSRPVQEAQRDLSTAQAARDAARSEVATTRINLARAKTLAAEGLISQRDLETAQQAFDTASARLDSAQAQIAAASQELERQQKLASTNVAGTAEVGAAQSALAAAQADVQTRQAERERANSQLQLTRTALAREQSVYRQGIANSREISQARANLQTARAQIEKARQTQRVANATLSREQKIFRQNLNNTSQVQAAQAGYRQAQADLKAARTALSILKSSPGGAASVPVRAPISGVVQERNVAQGEAVQADDPLMTLVNLQTVAIEAQLFEADFAKARIGSPVTVTTDALPGKTFRGRITFLGAQVDPQSRTVTARALIDNPGILRPGMFARGQIQTGVSKLTLVVPASAVLQDGAATIVFVKKGKSYGRIEVTTGTKNNNRIAITSGLEQGDQVVVEGASALRAQAARGAG